MCIRDSLIMVLWAGGLYGLNSLCRSALSQAAGAVIGAFIIGVMNNGMSILCVGIDLQLVIAELAAHRGTEAVTHALGIGADRGAGIGLGGILGRFGFIAAREREQRHAECHGQGNGTVHLESSGV